MRTIFPWSAACLLAGCGIQDIPSEVTGRHVNMSGAGIVLNHEPGPYSAGDLAELISKAAPPGTESKAAPSGTEPSQVEDPDRDLAVQLATFDSALYSVDARDPSARAAMQNRIRNARNEIQGTLLMHSSTLCNAYQQRLREVSSMTTFGLDALGTGLSAAGALFSNGSSRVLSGLSAGVSGINAAYSKDIMSSVTTAVIIPGIDKQRAAVLQNIANRRCLGISSYPLSVALQDVIIYHTSCSTDVGIAAAGSALSRAQTQTTSKTQSQTVSDLQSAMTSVAAINKVAAKTLKSVPAETNPKPASRHVAAGTKSHVAAAAKPPAPATGATADADTTASANNSPSGGNAAGSGASAPTGTAQLVGSQIELPVCQALNQDGIEPPPSKDTAEGAENTDVGH